MYVILLTKCIQVEGQPLPELKMSKRAGKMDGHYQLKCELKGQKSSRRRLITLRNGNLMRCRPKQKKKG